MSEPQQLRRPPVFILILAGIATLFFVLPFLGLLFKTPWGSFVSVVSDSWETIRLSLLTSICAALISAVLGVPLAWVLGHTQFRGRRFVRALCLLSLVLPPVVGGVALLSAYGKNGLLGGFLFDVFGWRLAFTTTGVIFAQTFVAMPFLVLAVEGAVRARQSDEELAARTLGATSWFTFRHVTLPALKPALLAGMVLAWARALGEFGATITFAGNYPGTTQTLPLSVYVGLEGNRQNALVLSMIMIALSFIVLFSLRDRWFGDSA